MGQEQRTRTTPREKPFQLMLEREKSVEADDGRRKRRRRSAIRRMEIRMEIRTEVQAGGEIWLWLWLWLLGGVFGSVGASPDGRAG